MFPETETMVKNDAKQPQFMDSRDFIFSQLDMQLFIPLFLFHEDMRRAEHLAGEAYSCLPLR